jgi:hypothetical protein
MSQNVPQHQGAMLMARHRVVPVSHESIDPSILRIDASLIPYFIRSAEAVSTRSRRFHRRFRNGLRITGKQRNAEEQQCQRTEAFSGWRDPDSEFPVHAVSLILLSLACRA